MMSGMSPPRCAPGTIRGHLHLGFSLIELSMVLGIVSLILAGVMLFFEGASERSKMSDWITEMASIRSAMDSLSGGSALDTADDWGALVSQSKALPSKWTYTGPGNP